MPNTGVAGAEACVGCVAVRKGFCAGLDAEALERIATVAQHVRLSPAQRMRLPGQESPGLLILRRGRLKVSHTLKDGRQQITDFLLPGDALVWRRNGADTEAERVIEAMAEIEACELDVRTLLSLCDETPAIARMLVTAAISEIERKNDQVMMLGRKRSEERLASFLLALIEADAPSGASGQRGLRINLPMSRQEIGDYVGLTIETVSRTFTALRQAGIIALAKPQVVEIRDLDALRELAAGASEWRNGG